MEYLNTQVVTRQYLDMGYLQALECRVKFLLVLCGGERGAHPLKLRVFTGLMYEKKNKVHVCNKSE